MFQKAFALTPNYAIAHLWHALVLACQGRLDLSLDEHRRASELDPLSFIIIDRSAEELRFAGHFTEAIEASRRAAGLRTEIFIPGLGERVMALLALGRQAEAIELARTIRQAATLRPRWNSDGYAIWALERAGLKQEAADYAAEIIKMPEENYVRGFALLALGRFAEALPSLEHTPPLSRRVFLWDAMFDSWRDDPRFQQLLVKLGCTAEYQVARETLARMIKEQAAKK
jgi:tetratricopeptide (TPR) repeat protein